MLTDRRILLVIGGGIAAFKTPDLIRKFMAEGAHVTPVLTRAGAQFVTPLTLSTLAGEPVHQDLFDLTREAEIGHIQLSRAADLVVVAPATADMMAKMAGGHADDLASTLLMATDKRVLIAPAMNVRMWEHPATQRNRRQLEADGALFIGPDEGEMACREYGPGRMSEPLEIVAAAREALAARTGGGPLAGRRILVTSGPTHEPIDPVRYIANRSSGAQGTAIAEALRDLGAQVRFVTGPAEAPRPKEVEIVEVESARQMLEAVEGALNGPGMDAAVFAAAVADWRVARESGSKIKKTAGGAPPTLEFAENPDILRTVSQRGAGRPGLVVGFAAETDDVVAHATAKRQRKGCDWIVANDVSPATGIMGGKENAVILITDSGAEPWPRLSKTETARRLAARIAAHFDGAAGRGPA